MKYFALVALFLCLIVIRAENMKIDSTYGGSISSPPSAGGYGGIHMRSPLCPKNYLFSCQPRLQPAPCYQPISSGVGGTGAYSENYPVYALQVPQYIHEYKTY